LPTKVNTKARINRHLRIFKDDIWISKKNKKTNQSYTFILFVILLLTPIYPSFASFIHNNNQFNFDRGDIDEQSIIWSYYWDNEEEDEDTPILESSDSFLSVNTILDDERDLSWTNEILDYEVKPWESFYSIAYKFKVSTNSIYWANNFSKNHTLQPGDILKIPPVSGLIHQVKKWETLSAIAKKYDVDEDKIKSQNLLSIWETLQAWEVLVIPGAIKKSPKPIYKKPTSYAKTSAKSWYKFAQAAKSQYTTNKGSYNLIWHKPQSWAAWNCTWYVASYKKVNWRWNANRWMANARAKWHATWSAPKVWAIVQFTGRWYNPRYGHVAIVMDLKDDYMIVSDMNYRRLYEVTYRKVPVNDRSIDWYIYID